MKGKQMESEDKSFKVNQWVKATVYVDGGFENEEASSQFAFELNAQDRQIAIGYLLEVLRANHETVKQRMLGFEKAIRRLEAELANG